MSCPRCGFELPEPLPRFCPACGRDLAQAAPSPQADGAPPEEPVPPPPVPAWVTPAETPPATAGGTPWEDRSRIGFGTALFETTKQVLATPAEFFRRMPVEGGIGGPLLYALIVGYFGIVVSAIYDAVFRSVMGTPRLPHFARYPELQRLMPMLEGGGNLVFQLLFGPFMLLIALFLSAGIYHLLLLLLGGARRGFEATFRVISYSQATGVLLLVPICGNLLLLVYWCIVATIGLSEAHGIGRGKAAAAVLLPLVLVCCCCVVGILVLVGGAASMLGGMR